MTSIPPRVFICVTAVSLAVIVVQKTLISHMTTLSDVMTETYTPEESGVQVAQIQQHGQSALSHKMPAVGSKVTATKRGEGLRSCASESPRRATGYCGDTPVYCRPRMTSDSHKNISGSATIKDVARVAGVSIKTVSRVINGERYVSDATAKRVRQAAAELDYTPNLMARSLATDRSYQIALWHGLTKTGISSYYTEFQNSFVSACQSLGYGAMLDPLDPRSTDVEERAISLLRQQRPCCVVTTPPFSDNEVLLSRLDSEGITYLRISPSSEDPGRPFVGTDDRKAARKMTEYLIECGHRRIAFIFGPLGHRVVSHGAAARRTDGFLEALEAHGLPREDELLVRGKFTFESGVSCARQLLSLAKPPTAIFAGNDDMAAGVIHYAHEVGLRLPQDLSVAGFDDTAIARYIYPSLTSVRQPIPEMIRVALDFLVTPSRKGERPPPRLAERIPSTLIIRNSVGPPAAEPARRSSRQLVS